MIFFGRLCNYELEEAGMMELCPPDQCTGCAACAAKCPIEAISMQEDVHGFYQPVIQASICTDCALCRLTCPVLSEESIKRLKQPDVYAGWSVSDSIRTNSSSGGIFSVLAQAVMREDGKVFAAALDAGFKLRHREVNGLEDLHAFRGSKYLQSFIGETYQQIACYAKLGVRVMFVGTPCQVAGLYGFLKGVKGNNVLTCELVCHGVPSQKIFDSYLQFLQNQGYSGFCSIDFRDRKTSNRMTTISYHNPLKSILLTGKQDYFQQAFIRNLISRKACYNCKFARLPRVGDITLGDFWGLGLEEPFLHDKSKGVSLILANSSQGAEMLQKCEHELFLERRLLSEAVKKNQRVCRASGLSPQRGAFLSDLETKSVEQIVRKYRLHSPMTFRSLVYFWGRRLLGVRLMAFVSASMKRRGYA
ncbi:MAG: 4Fe-4S dicluster domain-containing protein [Chlorobiaceae bacterium]|nr:4Fe-4S dicluster domain-containing protein [Chlorobiaceae bacterium]